MYKGEGVKDEEEDRKFPPMKAGQNINCILPPTIEVS